jgi:hypothetical protein
VVRHRYRVVMESRWSLNITPAKVTSSYSWTRGLPGGGVRSGIQQRECENVSLGGRAVKARCCQQSGWGCSSINAWDGLLPSLANQKVTKHGQETRLLSQGNVANASSLPQIIENYLIPLCDFSRRNSHDIPAIHSTILRSPNRTQLRGLTLTEFDGTTGQSGFQ